MLSALAKYIFGGIMNDDAPETTSMQYETREINDWLLVDMPDQDIDNEDMDSESDDDDDILTAVPLLLGEEASMSSRQIVLSYDGDSPCDKSYAKIRKGFHNKIHSASSKAHVHTGDKIQGNFVANVEAISLGTDDISNGKVKCNLSEVQENVKPKQSKSKISKPKKSKRNKINKKCSIKLQDNSINTKKCDNVQDESNDNVQENLSDKIAMKLKEEVGYWERRSSTEIPESSGIETECRSENKVEEDSHFAIEDKSNLRHADTIEDYPSPITDNYSHRNADKDENSDNELKENFSPRNVIKVEEDSLDAITRNPSHKIQSACDNSLQNCINIVEENVTNMVSKESDEKIQCNLISVECNLNQIGKRSYADVVKAKYDVLNKDTNKQVSLDKTYKNEPELPEVSLHDKAQDVQMLVKSNNTKLKCKKSRSKKVSKSTKQNETDVESQNISASNHDEFYKNVNDKKDLLNKISSVSCQIQESSHYEIKGDFNNKDVSAKSAEKTCRNLDTSLEASENFEDDILENCSDKVQENIDCISKSKICQVQKNFEIIQGNFAHKDEAILISDSENCESRLQDVSNVQGTEDIFERNLNYDNVDFENDDNEDDFNYDIYFGSFENIENEHEGNLTDNCQIASKEENDNYQNKVLDSFEFQQNLDDGMLESIADLWDIYTKIQDNSDDEMNENLQDKEMDETSDEQITDDEMNENSQDENDELSDDEFYTRSCGRIFKNFFGEENAKLYNRVFDFSLNEESEESDSEMFTDTQDRLILPSIKRYAGRKPGELLQPFTCEIPKHHSSCVPITEYELVEYFNFEPKHFYACQTLQYPSSYALAIAEYYSNHDQYVPKYTERCNAFVQKYKKRAVEKQTPPASNEPSLITNSADLLQKIINQKCSTLPTKTAVVLEHVKDLKSVQQAIQYEARKYMTRSQLNRQNRNYIYQSSSKTNRRRNLQRNHSGVNNNRKCY